MLVDPKIGKFSFEGKMCKVCKTREILISGIRAKS